MGSVNEIAIGAERKQDAVKAMELAAMEVLRIEAKYSRYRSDANSIVHQINRGAGAAAPIVCDPETMELLHIAGRLHQSSDGLFDATSGVLRRAWDFSKPVVPRLSDLKPLLQLIDWTRVELGPDTVRLPVRGMEIDFGGFGKEYATDRAAATLVRHGVKHGYVNLGGDIHAIGGQPDGTPWRFGVKNPREASAVVANIEIASGGLATSGDYEKYFEIDGERFCHILNPRTGFPVKCWRSVSVTGVSTLVAGALSTVAMLKESAAASYLSRSNCSYLLIDAAGHHFANSHTTNAE